MAWQKNLVIHCLLSTSGDTSESTNVKECDDFQPVSFVFQTNQL